MQGMSWYRGEDRRPKRESRMVHLGAFGATVSAAAALWAEQEGCTVIRVIIESPYAGDIERNVRYARACMADSLRRGEAPFASHLLYTQPGILRDEVLGERDLGIAAGFAWGDVAELVAIYDDLGISKGMGEGHRRALGKFPVVFRCLGGEWSKPAIVVRPRVGAARGWPEYWEQEA